MSEVMWDPARLAACCDAIQESYRKGVELPDGDPRNEFVADVIVAGRAVLDGILGMPDGEHIVELIDALPPEALRLLAFERAWCEGHERERRGS